MSAKGCKTSALFFAVVEFPRKVQNALITQHYGHETLKAQANGRPPVFLRIMLSFSKVLINRMNQLIAGPNCT